MFFYKNISIKSIVHFLLVVIVSVSFVLFGSSKGGGGSKGGDGGGSGNCQAVKPSTISLIFPLASDIPGRKTTDGRCIVLPIAFGNPSSDYGAESIYNPNLYYCKITVRGSCPSFIREYIWRTPQLNFPIEVPTEQTYSVLVNYYEPCNSCNSLSPGRAQLGYKEDFGGHQSLFVARLNFIGNESCN